MKNHFMAKTVLIALLGTLLLSACKGKLSSRYKTKKIGCDTMFSKVELKVPVFKAQELAGLNKALEDEMNMELRKFNSSVKDEWLDWYVANEKYYPGTKTDPFVMSAKIDKIMEDENTIVILLKGFKDDGYPKKRDWQKTATYTKSTGEVTFDVLEEVVPLE